MWLLAAVLLLSLISISADAANYKFNMSYIYFGNSSAYTTLVDTTQNSLSEVAPNYFTLNSNGSLVVTNAVSQSFVNDMHSQGIRVVPYLTNDWGNQIGINALNNRDALSESIVNAVATYNLDGVNIDIENLNENQRAIYVDFIRLLRAKLPVEKTIAVAVAANPYNNSTGWSASYDYALLAQH